MAHEKLCEYSIANKAIFPTLEVIKTFFFSYRLHIPGL